MSRVQVFEATRVGPNNKRRGQTAGLKIPDRLRVAAYVRVSTDGDEQLGSFASQKQYYEDKIKSNSEWAMAGIYADEAITGTKVDKREQFQEMINRCMEGEIDMILTKSISRFARNTVDLLRYVRMLRDRNISVIFEKENLDTLSMNGEMFVTLLSALAQQEVESLSSNVKMGFRMKMKRGEILGFNGCLGYDYHPEDKSITVNQEEAATVRLIYDLYLQGYGTTTIARKLTEMGIKNKKGIVSWHNSGILGIIKNEKYKGDLLMGKTFTVDPIGKRRIANMGEVEKFLTVDHHEPIVSREVWDKAQEIRMDRIRGRVMEDNGMRERRTRQYTFSSMCECGFCGHKLSRRSRQQNTRESKPVWQCMNATKNGIASCPHCKSIDESVLESAFLEAYKLLAGRFDDVIESVLATIEEVLRDDADLKRVKQIDKEMAAAQTRKSRLTDLLIDGTITKEDFEEKAAEMDRKLSRLTGEKAFLEKGTSRKKNISRRMQELRQTLNSKDPLDVFDRAVFESIVEKIIVGGCDSDGNPSPYNLTFVLKSNETMSAQYDLKKYKAAQKDSRQRQGSSRQEDSAWTESGKEGKGKVS